MEDALANYLQYMNHIFCVMVYIYFYSGLCHALFGVVGGTVAPIFPTIPLGTLTWLPLNK